MQFPKKTILGQVFHVIIELQTNTCNAISRKLIQTITL